MNRLHVHISVDDLERSIGFYATLLGAEPTVLKDDYAKWRLDDPAVNFAISDRGRADSGIEHLGIEADSRDNLDLITGRLKAAQEKTFDQVATTCCYAVSDKSWVKDPSGVRWETFFTYQDTTSYGADASSADITTEKANTPEPPLGRCC